MQYSLQLASSLLDASLVPLYRSLIVGLETGNSLNEGGPNLPGFSVKVIFTSDHENVSVLSIGRESATKNLVGSTVTSLRLNIEMVPPPQLEHIWSLHIRLPERQTGYVILAVYDRLDGNKGHVPNALECKYTDA